MTKNTKILLIIFLLLTYVSCRKQTKVDGIDISDFDNALNDSKTNRIFCNMVSKTLKGDEKALGEMVNFWCGGASDCYDLGDIVTQIIYKMGDSTFTEMAYKLSYEDKKSLYDFIGVGLEYGSHGQGKIENEFPKLFAMLNHSNIGNPALYTHYINLDYDSAKEVVCVKDFYGDYAYYKFEIYKAKGNGLHLVQMLYSADSLIVPRKVTSSLTSNQIVWTEVIVVGSGEMGTYYEGFRLFGDTMLPVITIPSFHEGGDETYKMGDYFHSNVSLTKAAISNEGIIVNSHYTIKKFKSRDAMTTGQFQYAFDKDIEVVYKWIGVLQSYQVRGTYSDKFINSPKDAFSMNEYLEDKLGKNYYR
jgi:hypothetical protein